MEMNYWESNPGPVKCALSLMKKCGETLRLPLVPVRDDTRRKIERMLGSYRLLTKRAAGTPLSDALRAADRRALRRPGRAGDEARRAVAELLAELDAGRVRAAENEGGRWVPRPWVKRGILLGFRVGTLTELPMAGPLRFIDKDTFPLKTLSAASGVRVVPGRHLRAAGRLPRARRHDHAARLRQRRRVRRRRNDDRFARARGLVRAGRAGASTSPRAPRSAESSSPWATCPSSSRTTSSSAATAGSTRERSCARRAVLGAGVILTASTPVYDVVRGRSTAGPRTRRSRSRRARSSCPARGRSARAVGRSGACRSRRP